MSARSRKNLPVVGAAVLLGTLGALALVPRSRVTMATELSLALGGRPAWLKASTWSASGEPRPAAVKRAVSAASDDVELQIAAATLPSSSAAAVQQALNQLARRFPESAVIRAHQLRHLTRGGLPGSGIEIQRADFAQFEMPGSGYAGRAKTRYPDPAALREFRTAADAGGRLEPENGFFPAMRAVGEFAAGEDVAALQYLRSAAAKPVWDDHALEETRAQALLLRQLYGDRGAVQRALNASSLLLPHFAPLRLAARLAVWHAEQRQRAGDAAAARAIRRSVMQLGIHMAEQSPLLIGKLVGTGIFQIGLTPIPPTGKSFGGRPPEVLMREEQDRYAAALEAQGALAEARWVRAQGERLDALHQRADHAFTVVSNSHEELLFPPVRVLGWWATGVLLLKQIAALLIVWAAALLLGRLRLPAAAPGARLTQAGAGLALLLAPALAVGLIGGVAQLWHTRDAGVPLRLLAATAVLAGAEWWWSRSSIGRRTVPPALGPRLSIALLLILTPILLIGVLDSLPLVSAILGGGLWLLAFLGLARWSGRRAKTDLRLRWQPALVALVSVLPTTVWILHTRDLLAWDTQFRQQVLGLSSPGQENFGGIGNTVPLLVLLPIGLLLFFVLARVAALELPVRTGIARGLRQTAAAALALLTAAYLGTLLPTVAQDYRADHQIQQTMQDELAAAEHGSG